MVYYRSIFVYPYMPLIRYQSERERARVVSTSYLHHGRHHAEPLPCVNGINRRSYCNAHDRQSARRVRILQLGFLSIYAELDNDSDTLWEDLWSLWSSANLRCCTRDVCSVLV